MVISKDDFTYIYPNQNPHTFMKIAGTILLALGFIGTIVFGYQAFQDSETFSFLGIDVAVSSANWTPLIISALILIVGLILTTRGRK